MIRVMAIASLAGLGSLTAVIVAQAAEEKHLRAELKTATDTVARAKGCDAALGALDHFAVEARCSSSIKTLVAQANALTAERDDALSILAQVRRDQAAAITRAEARGRSETLRTQNAQTRLDAAPRTPAGLRQCDADCLQRLGEP